MVNYKKIIPNQNIRLKILNHAKYIPDKLMIKIQYRIKTGRKLNLKNPMRFTEKIQWYKLNYRNPLMTKCSDKYAVREYVVEKGLSHLLNPLYGVYETPEEIDFDSLPNAFAIKYNTGSGANLFITDKSEINTKEIKEIITSWLKNRVVKYGREWAYYDIKPKIIIERLLPRDKNNDLPDYKFFCFNGKVKYLYTMVDYVDDHAMGRCSFYTPDFKKLPYRRSEFMEINRDIPKPANFEKMIKYAEILAVNFPHVRVDFYNIEGEIIFGELTFYNASGYTVFTPDEFDYILGREFSVK